MTKNSGFNCCLRGCFTVYCNSCYAKPLLKSEPCKECAKLTPFAAQLGTEEIEWDDLWKLNYMVVVEMLQSGEVDEWIKLS